MPRYSTADHSILKSIAWEPEKPAERINDHIVMSRSTSNAYIVTHTDGDVVINTGTPYQGARTRERFEQLLGRPLNVSKIVFTQSHPDHIGGWASFAGPSTETLVQREFPRICEERKRLAPYFQPRAARVLKSMIPKKEHADAWYSGTRDPAPLTLFADRYDFSVGRRRFELISAPSGETLDSLLVWLPAERTLFTGNWAGAIQGALPNFYTARGDRDRSVVGWLGWSAVLLGINASMGGFPWFFIPSGFMLMDVFRKGGSIWSDGVGPLEAFSKGIRGKLRAKHGDAALLGRGGAGVLPAAPPVTPDELALQLVTPDGVVAFNSGGNICTSVSSVQNRPLIATFQSTFGCWLIN